MSKKSYDLPNIQRPEDVELYLKSFNLGRTRQAEIDCAAAFGAIRRAAEYARYHERRAADWKRNGVQDLSDNCAFTADGIRRAIRAAIGSPKA